MLRIILVRPGATDYDEQGRIAGALDIPLCHNGAGQVARVVDELADLPIDLVYAAPCQASQQTAQAIAAAKDVKVRRLDKLQNLNMGLWQGRLIDDVRQTQPTVYRQWREHPDTVCPPDGEPLAAARSRISASLEKVLKKHRDGMIALVVSEPLCSVLRSELTHEAVGDLWAADSQSGTWEVIEVSPQVSA